MIKSIRWAPDERLFFRGRNGMGKCRGVSLAEEDGMVSIQPITSKGLVGNCEITIPVSAIPELIEALSDCVLGGWRTALRVASD